MNESGGGAGVFLELHEGFGEIVLARPERKNAVDSALAQAFDRLVAEVGSRSDVGAVMLRGAGGTFCSGGDLDALAAIGTEEALALMARMRRALRALRRLPKPVLTWIEGDAVGGGAEMALSGDIVLMHPAARITFAQARLGLTPGWGGRAFLEDRLGAARSRAVLLEARRIGADEALRCGLADRILPDLEAARRAAQSLAGLAPEVVQSVKAPVDQATGASFARLWTHPNRPVRSACAVPRPGETGEEGP